MFNVQESGSTHPVFSLHPWKTMNTIYQTKYYVSLTVVYNGIYIYIYVGRKETTGKAKA
jgi:hypothetical protein